MQAIRHGSKANSQRVFATAQSSKQVSVLFVCLGNVCRSPTAEAVFKRKLQERDLDNAFSVDSCGLGGGSKTWWWNHGGVSYHEGEEADERMRHVASKRGVHLDSISRPLTKADLEHFDKIICADDFNIQIIDNVVNRWAEDGTGWSLPEDGVLPRVHKMVDYAPKGSKVAAWSEIPDPYYLEDDLQPFDQVVDLVEEAADGLLNTLIAEFGISQ